MANKAHKTEHSGAKHARGAYRGSKQDAKHESNKARRVIDVSEERDDFDHENRYADNDRPEYERELPEDYEPSPYDGTYSED